MDNKRGLSTIIVTIIMILLAIVTAGIIWVVIVNLIDEGTSEISFGRFLIDLKIENAHVEGGNIIVNVKRNVGEGDLRGIKFIFSDGTISESGETEIILEELDQEIFTFTLSKIISSETKTVSIAPIYGSEKTIGAITDTFIIKEISNENGETGGICSDGSCNNGENCNTCSIDCGTCGSDGSVCGDGICDVGESCSADCDESSEECIPDCAGKNCGSDGCLGGSCGICSEGGFCNNINQCEADSTINSGIIESVWPLTAVKYFDSEDLPKDVSIISSYIGKFVKFSGTETRCLRVTYAEYLDEPSYDRSYIRVELISEISNGDSYEIWQTDTCGS